MDDIRTSGAHAVFFWTLEGTNTGPGGTCQFVRLRGWEEWDLSDTPRIRASRGWCDAADYELQVAHGADG